MIAPSGAQRRLAARDQRQGSRHRSQSQRARARQEAPADAIRSYTLGQLNGTLDIVPLRDGERARPAHAARVAEANGWSTHARRRFKYPPIEHVVYIIKENRTYDQVLGDLRARRRRQLAHLLPASVSPNHHALAERFGTYDRFFVNAEVSAQGHPWSTAGYVTDYIEKTTPDIYRGRRPEPDEPGDVDDPAIGLSVGRGDAKGICRCATTVSMPSQLPRAPGAPAEKRYKGNVRALLPSLQPYTNPTYPPFDMSVPDQLAGRRVARGVSRVRARGADARARDSAPSRAITRRASAPGCCTPRAYMADNDLALGRIVEALSHSQFWKHTAVFVLEDDAQAGPDHVDSHRSVMLAISPWARGGVLHRFVNTTDVLATIEEMLGLGAFSQFDHFGRPLREIWRSLAGPSAVRRTPVRAVDRAS